MKGIIIPLTEEEFEAHLEAAFQKVIDKCNSLKGSEVYLTRKEVAEKLHISLPTLHEYTKSGNLKAYKIMGRVLYKEDEIDLVLENRLKTKKR